MYVALNKVRTYAVHIAFSFGSAFALLVILY